MPGVAIRAAILRAQQQLLSAIMVNGLSLTCAHVCNSPDHFGDYRTCKHHVFHFVQHRSFAVIDNVAPFYNVPTVERAAIRHAPLRVLLYAVNDAFAVYGAFPFGQHFEHSQLQHASRTAGDFLTGVEYFNTGFAQHDAR
nr:hypothetical protein [Adlercreutzia equolifaciens]